MAYKEKDFKERSRDRDRDRDRDEDKYDKTPKRKKWGSAESLKNVDYKDVRFLSRFVTERGKILPRRITGLNIQQQRSVVKAIKRARQMSLLPFINYGS